MGQEPYGLYPLQKDRTRILAVDFDDDNLDPVNSFLQRSSHYDLPAYVERSKSKGFHVWVFFETPAAAWKVRRIAQEILNDIDRPDTEVFPKQDKILGESPQFGNFINLPLFGKSVRENRCVFLDAHNDYRVIENQWDFLESLQTVDPAHVNELIELNGPEEAPPLPSTSSWGCEVSGLEGLPPCARKMLAEGVTTLQRLACFRLSVQLRRIGLPYDLVVALLIEWREYNRPSGQKRRITAREVRAQVASAYLNDYRSFGCEDESVKPFCVSSCPVYSRTAQSQDIRDAK